MEFQLPTARMDFFTRSLVEHEGVEYGLVRSAHGPRLAVLGPAGTQVLEKFQGENSEFAGSALLICPLSPANAQVLRRQLAWLNPRCMGLATSAGMGDRLGIATPGHVRAVREAGGGVAPIFAQQSIREMQRTGRSPQQVLDDAMWGVFEEGWRDGFAADADHLKTAQDIDACLTVGFTFFTLDPGEYVDNTVDRLDDQELISHAARLPDHLQPAATGLAGRTIDFDGVRLSFNQPVLLKAAIKYGKALDHIINLYLHLQKAAGKHLFEVEISMDETEQPTSPAEHIYIASELHRRGVRWVSFAPRLIGSFEKGVDYIGDLQAFEADLAIHAAIARQYGPYKLSLHSGSDKFSIYSIFMRQTEGMAHLKTAGTSYLEALRTVAVVEPEFLKDIYVFALEHFEADKKSYHISAQTSRAPKPDEIRDWPGLLAQFDARQILHVTFGSVLKQTTSDGQTQFYDHLMHILTANRELYFDNLARHFKRHLEPFLSIAVERRAGS